MADITILERVEQQLDHDQATVARCADMADAVALTKALTRHLKGDTLDIRLYPVTNDEEAIVEAHDVCIRKLHYEHDLGWFSSDLPEQPEFDFTDKQLSLSEMLGGIQ